MVITCFTKMFKKNSQLSSHALIAESLNVEQLEIKNSKAHSSKLAGLSKFQFAPKEAYLKCGKSYKSHVRELFHDWKIVDYCGRSESVVLSEFSR